MKKRLVSLLLIFCLLLTMFPFAALAAEDDGTSLQKNPFADVKQSDWFYDAVQYVRINDIFTGVAASAFAPNGTLTRGMFVTVLGRMAGVDASNYRGLSPYMDVAGSAYYAPYVLWASMYGITEGTGEGLFSPDLPIDRQQLATFIMRYFEAFHISCLADADEARGEPADFDQVADWAKDAVRYLWQTGLLEGDGTAFDPTAHATRAQTAALCTRLDGAVEIWYTEPGVESERVSIDPEDVLPDDEKEDEEEDEKEASWQDCDVRFYDGDRLIDTLSTRYGTTLSALPAVEKSSKEGAFLVGYYTDPECTQPFYAEDFVMKDTKVYAKYEPMEQRQEVLTFTSFTLEEAQPADLRFDIQWQPDEDDPADYADPDLAATLHVKDGSAPVALRITDEDSDGIYTVEAENGFNKGCTYSLELAEDWVFAGKPETMRTASFFIEMEEVEKLQMNSTIAYIHIDDIDYNGDLFAALEHENFRSASFDFGEYTGKAPEAGNLVCIYDGVHPEHRGKNADMLAPAVYLTISAVNGNSMTIAPMGEDDATKLYEIPDNFPITVSELPAGDAGTTTISALDALMYESMLGEEDGTLDRALEKAAVGDFVTLYVDDADGIAAEDELYFAKITDYDAATGIITYEKNPNGKQDIIDSMDLYTKVDIDGDDLISEAEEEHIETVLLAQVEESDFAEEAVCLLTDMVTKTDGFQNNLSVYDYMITDESGDSLSDAQVDQLDFSTYEISRMNMGVDLLTDSRSGQRHFKNGVQMAIDVDTRVIIPISGDGSSFAVDLSATFIQEVSIDPGARGDLVYKEILFIPVPIGVEVNAHIDVKSYTAFSFDATVQTLSGGQVLDTIDVSDELQNVMDVAEQTGISEEYKTALQELMAQYNELLTTETDWVDLVEQQIVQAEVSMYGLCAGVEVSFVAGADMNIAIGSQLEYEVGKRYSFWFKIGLFTPTAGSDTTDLINEKFAFQFYVMGKLGVRAGIKAKVYVGIGTADLASVGIAAELGPYVKLYGFFLYEYSKYRPANTQNWTYEEQMAGALFLEFGLYFKLSFEANALWFEYSHDFIDKEFPLMYGGNRRYYYAPAYEAAEDETVIVQDENYDSRDGVTMTLPKSILSMSYLDLDTGDLGSEALSYDQFHYSLSNSAFSIDSSTGLITVDVPDEVRFLECDLTITYKHAKLAFSTYDMSVTVPLVWTNLATSELNVYYTAQVRVGNWKDGYRTVWSKRVLQKQPFDLPDGDEILALIGWTDGSSNARYTDYYDAQGRLATGYGSQQTEGLTIYEDNIYDFNVDIREYALTVTGIENAEQLEGAVSMNDGTYSKTYYAPYGQTFDLSELANTGTTIPGETYTKFKNVTATALDGSAIDLTKPVNGSMAEKLAGATVTANYLDDSVAAIFTFNGVPEEDVTLRVRKGTAISDAQYAYIESIVEAHKDMSVQSISPDLGPINGATNYIVNCGSLSGARATITLDENQVLKPWHTNQDTVDDVVRLEGSYIGILPTPEKTGYEFLGWYEDDDTFNNLFVSKEMPVGGIELHAKWKPLKYTVNFHLNNGNTVEYASKVVTYDDVYGAVDEAAHNGLPTAKWTGSWRFDGWWTEPMGAHLNTYPTADSTEITADTLVQITEDQTLYAYWKELIDIPGGFFDFGQTETYTYTPGTTRQAQYTLNTGMTYTDRDGETFHYPTDGFTIRYKSDWDADYVSLPRDRGVYFVTVTRDADDTYKAFNKQYYAVLDIRQANSSLSTVPTVKSKYYGTVVPNAITGGFTGEAIEYGISTSASSAPGNWQAGPVSNVFDSLSGSTFYLWARVAETRNYTASQAKVSKSFSLTAPGPFLAGSYYTGSGAAAGSYTYKLVIHTADIKNAGTNSDIYASFGGSSYYHLDDPNDKDDNERNDTNTHNITNYVLLPNGSGALPVSIKLDTSGSSWHWTIDEVRVEVYKDGTLIKSEAYKQKYEFDEDGETLNLSFAGFGPSFSSDSFGMEYYGSLSRYGTTTVDLNADVTDTGWRDISFDPWQNKYAPTFTASFSDPRFDRYITWNSYRSFTIDNSGVYQALQDLNVASVKFTYGVSGRGVDDDMMYSFTVKQ